MFNSALVTVAKQEIVIQDKAMLEFGRLGLGHALLLVLVLLLFSHAL